MLGSAQVRACLPRKPCSAGKDSWLNAQVRTAPNLPRKSWSVPGFWANARVRSSAPVLPRTPCSVLILGKMLRSAGSRFRSTGAPKMPGNSSNEGHYTPPAVVKCKFPLSGLRGEATYYTHRAVAESRFPSTMPLHLKESFEYRFYSRSMKLHARFLLFSTTKRL